MRNDANTANKGTITYTYDAAGTKLKKSTVENSAGVTYNGTSYTTDITTTTTYLNGMVFESKQYSNATVNTGLGYVDKLQFLPQEEGRIRAVYDPANPNTLTSLEYDYMIKDHLGNVRMVLTEELKTDAYPVASMEDVADRSNLSDQSNYIPYYANTDYVENSAVRYPTASADGYPTSPGNDYVARLKGDTRKIGPSVLLKVMAGDKFHLRVFSWWNTGSTPSGTTSPLTDLAAALLNGVPGMSGGKVGVGQLTNGILTPGLTDFLNDPKKPYNSARPKAYINWVLLDEQFKFVESSSNAEQVGGSGAHTFHEKDNLPVHKNGYLYIYVSNETDNINVYFDDLQVTHVRGSLSEESHYYPFGLVMSGISSSAAGTLKNKYKFGGKELRSNEFSDGSGMELYDFDARNYDQQIGRFWSGDRKADKLVEWSPYVYAVNNPILFVDPDGEFPYPVHIRSFAPWKSFGLGFEGDNRGYSTALGKGEGGTVTSRVQQSFIVDPSKGTHTDPRTWSDPSRHAWGGEKTATPTGEITDFKSSTDNNGNSTVSFNSTYAGANPLVPGSPNIDVKTSFTLVENTKAGTLSVTATQKGDSYPVAETLIGDTKGNQLFIGVSPATGAQDTQKELGPFEKLPGNNNRAMMSNSFIITIDQNGVFTGVKQGDKTYSVADWNKMMQAKPLVKNDEKPFPPR